MLRLLFIGIALFVLGLLGLTFQELQAPGFLSSIPSNFVATFVQPVSEEEYTLRYREGSEALRSTSWDDARSRFESIKDQQHALQPMVWIQLSKVYAGLSREGDAQRLLNRLTVSFPSSKFEIYGNYLLAQSDLRSGQTGRAKDRFQNLVDNHPDSDLAQGAHYYLGEMAFSDKTPSVAAEHWLAYIRHSPNGAFAANAASGITSLKPSLTPTDHHALAKVYLQQDNLEQALLELKQTPLNLAWVDLATTYRRKNNLPASKATILQSLKLAKNQLDAEAGLKLLLSITPKGQSQKALLTQLSQQHLPYGGDMVLWQLRSYLKGAEQDKLAENLVKYYPKSDWAPESSWSRVWKGYKSGQATVFLPLANQHLSTFPYTRSAPRVLFWRAKTYQRLGKQAQAQADFEQLVAKYPRQFYAFRAQQILNHTQSPWLIPQTVSELPNSAPLEKPLALSMTNDEVMDKALQQLIRLGEIADVETLSNLFVTKSNRELVAALVAYGSKQPHMAIKKLSEAAFENYRAGHGIVPSAWPDSIYEVWYPIENKEVVMSVASQEHMNPLLILALTRQESAFNKLAISSSQAMGLMQLLPTTAAEVATQLKISGYSTPQLFIPETNIRLGTHYLKGLHDRFHGNSIEAIGAYNGGPGAMTKWRASIKTQDPDLFIEDIPYEQTRDYIKSVYAHYWNYCTTYHTCSAS